ncbi:MAG: preprotein translocase subunit YajC [Planctomycetota bacterium]|nr:preprotein translocase subunit YajC [Planctomycetota bacterium]
MLEMVAAGSPLTTKPVGEAPWWAQLFQNPIWLMVVVLVIFYVFVIRSKRNQDRQRKDMLGQLKRGDRIQTIGGILGTVVEAREGEVVVKVDESSNTKLRFVRSAIHRVVEAEKSPGK